MLYSGMEPTNDLGEQVMREHVIYRKIIGCFRSENGSQSYLCIASLLATWKRQGKNMFEGLRTVVVKELCLKWTPSDDLGSYTKSNYFIIVGIYLLIIIYL